MRKYWTFIADSAQKCRQKAEKYNSRDFLFG
jgi:hypothetical protein